MSNAPRTTVIRSSGSYVPPQVVTNEMISRIMDTTDEWIVPRTGIRERRFGAPGVGPAELAEHAARRALEKAGLAPKDIGLVVFATMTPDHYFPGSGGLLAARLGLTTTPALDIRMQCAGFLSGLQTADAFIRSGAFDRVLLVGAEVHSGLMPWPESVWDVMLGRSPGPCDPYWYERATGMRDRAVLFGDGAGAMVLEANESGDGRGFLGIVLKTDGNHWDKLYVPGGGCKSRPYFTPEMFESLGTIPIVEGLVARGATVRAFDPAAMQEARSLLPPIEYCADPYTAATGADGVVIATEWNQFRALNLAELRSRLGTPLLVDLRNLYEPARVAAAGLRYVSVGRAEVAP